MNHFLIRFCLALFLLLPPVQSATAKPADNTELQVFKAQTDARIDAAKENQQKDLQLHQQLVTSQNERIEQINHQVDWLGHLITLGSLIITLLLVVIGYFAYGKAKSDAEKIAKTVAQDEANTISKAEVKKWFDDNLATVNNEISALKDRLKQTTDEVAAHAEQTHYEMDKTNADLQAHAGRIIASNRLSSDAKSALTETDKQTLAQADTSLQNKPESQYTFEDWNTRAHAAYSEGNLSLAAEFWKKAAHATQTTDVQVAQALYNQGVALVRQNKPDEAIACCQQVVQRFGDATFPALQELVVNALVNQGVALEQQNKPDEAISCYQQVVQRLGDTTLPALQESVARALVNQGATLVRQNKIDEAIACCQQVVQRFGDATLPALQELVANALINQGVALQQQNKIDEAIACYQQVVQRLGDTTLPDLLETVARALVNQGATLVRQNKIDEAIACCQQVIQRFGDATLPALQGQVAQALNGYGFAQLTKAKRSWGNQTARTGLLTESFSLFGQAVEKAQTNDIKAIVLGNVSYAFWLLGRYEEAEPPLREALTLGGEEIFKAEIEDTKIATVPPDSGFVQLVTRLWSEIGSKH